MYKKEFKQHVWQDLLIGLVVTILLFLLREVIYHNNPGWMTDIIKVSVDESLSINIIITQYTITFLIVSLLSLLSGSGEYIYWVNVLEQKIIAPRHLNFTSLSVYAFISMFAGTAAFLAAKNDLVLIFFTVDVILLVFLTFRMTGVYFGKGRLRRKLHDKIEKEIGQYLLEPDGVKLESIEEKLNGIYENATRLAEKKQYGEILETDFQLLIDISEMMRDTYANDLAKIVYGNMTKILMIFQDSNDYIFSRLNTIYSPFSNDTLQPHTVEMLQSALGDYYEKVLADENYQLSQSFWISGVYRNLNRSYLALLEQTQSTAVILDNDYHNYEGEILFYHEDILGLNSLKLLELKFSVIHEKILRFARLIYKNSPELFFKVVNEHGMPIDIMREIDLLGLICDNELLTEAKKACTRLTGKLYLLELSRYMDTYHDYDMTCKISRATGNPDYYHRLIDDIKANAYTISKNYKDMVKRAAFLKEAPQIAQALLLTLDQDILALRRAACQHMEQVEKQEEVEYALLFNDLTYDALIYKMQIHDPDFLEILTAICDRYPEETDLCIVAKCLMELLTQENNLCKYRSAQSRCADVRRTDIKQEWVWGIDKAAREGK